MKSATNFQKILYQRVLLDNSDGFEPPRLHQKRNPLIKPMGGFFLISCGFCGCKTYHYGAWVFNRFQLFFNAICHESATTILPGSAKSKNRAKKEQGRALPMWILVFCNRFGDDFAERLSGLCLDIRQPCFRGRRNHDCGSFLRLSERPDVLVAVEVFLCPFLG